MDIHHYVNHVRTLFALHGKPDIAQGQMAYMRHQFEYFGLKMPEWTALTKQVFAETNLPEGEDLKAVVRLCFEDEHRELHYFGLELVQKSLKKQPPEFIDFMEELIRTQSWWDTVDWINKLVGLHFKRYPELIQPVTERWMASDYFWLQRICIIFQLTYRAQTDQELMFAYIRKVAHSKEFFLQKAAGWALRQYAKTNPAAVQQFLDTTAVAPLTRREALKALKKG